ncbi:hypothetical protein IRZ59_22020 [Pseudomonas guariconensis]|uniref:hypothetical protein n=1 Tax=Pseudomonas guariconensis TaxID=1288410 RepID=UPI0018AA5A47|nr:hypothetical protein [Pseudomonas guariconensis]MBF8733111.1 hypothetical protein [Pseudomonas guariconensis]
MTVSTTASTTQAFPNGVTTVFPINYRFFAKTDLKVFWLKPGGTVHLLILDSEYTVQGAGNEDGGSITTVGTPLNGGTLTIARIMTATQLTSFRNQGEFFAEIHEDAFDKLVMLVQQAIDNQGRGLTVPVSDPVGLDLEMPGAAVRATKMLGFDSAGSPVQSTMTMQQIEQQPALALASAQAAQASASAAAGSASAASGSAAAAAASAASVVGAAVYMFKVDWWAGTRAAIPAGYVPADGQTLSRALYPNAWAAINGGAMPTAADATWLSTPGERGRYTAGDGTTTFRVPDYNGKAAGSIAPLMVRGDGAAGFGTGSIRQDQIQNITGTITNSGSANFPESTITYGGAFKRGSTNRNLYPSFGNSGAAYDLTFDASGSARTGTETFPTHVIGCWIVKLFGAVTNQGSADAAVLATELANLTAAFQNSRAGSFANTFLYVEDRKATNTAGGTATAAAWTTRDLNSVRVNRITGASLASNQVTLPAGTYRFEARAPAIGVGAHQIRLRNITDATDVDIGSSGFSISSSLNAQTDSVMGGEFTITGTKVLEIQHNVATTRATNGFGAAANLGATEIYTQAKFWRLA